MKKDYILISQEKEVLGKPITLENGDFDGYESEGYEEVQYKVPKKDYINMLLNFLADNMDDDAKIEYLEGAIEEYGIEEQFKEEMEDLLEEWE